MRYFLYIAFNGAKYCGWQRQPNGTSVQEVVEKALGVLFGKETPILGAGRTDAGVNAYNLPAHIDLEQADTPQLEKWRRSLNGILPHDIAIRDIRPVVPTAHARFDAIERRYNYFVAREKDPFMGSFVLDTHRPLDYEAMNIAAQALIGEKDFTSFTKLHNDAKHNRCIVREAYWSASPYPGVWMFSIAANRFLRNMVRTIVGSLLEVGTGAIPPSRIEEILLGGDRSLAAATAKPYPLFLREVIYPQQIFLPDPE